MCSLVAFVTKTKIIWWTLSNKLLFIKIFYLYKNRVKQFSTPSAVMPCVLTYQLNVGLVLLNATLCPCKRCQKDFLLLSFSSYQRPCLCGNIPFTMLFPNTCRSFLTLWHLLCLSVFLSQSENNATHLSLLLVSVPFCLLLSLCPAPPTPPLESSVSSFWWCSVATPQCGASEIFMLTHIHTNTNLETQTFSNPSSLFLSPVGTDSRL